MKSLINILTLAIFSILLPPTAKACICNDPASPFLDSIAELKEFDFIARVRILNAYDNQASTNNDVVKIQILELFKGKAITQISEDMKNSSCDIGISDGEEWIFFGKKRNGKIIQYVCDRHHQIRNSDGMRVSGYNSDFNPLWKLREFYGHEEKKYNTEAHKEYYPNGQIELEEYYSNGKLEGVSKMWYPNGQLMNLDTFVNGRVVGLSRTWHSNGVLESSSYFIDGRQEGKVLHFYPTGQLSSVAYKKNYKHYNIYQTFYDTSKEYYSFDAILYGKETLDSLNSDHKNIHVNMEWVYDENGELLIKREYFRNGKISKEEIILDEPNFVLITYYHENGNLRSINYIKNGKNYGRYQQYDSSGVPNYGWDYDENGRVIKKD